MPFCDLDVQDIIVEIFNVLQMFQEHALKVKKILGVLWSFDTSEDRHNLISTFPGELKLAFANLQEVFASLDKGLVLGKDRLISIKDPILSWWVLLNQLLILEADVFPFFAALNTFLKILHTFFDVTLKHVVFVDLGSATLDNLVAYLSQETLHAFGCVVIFTKLPDDSHAVQYLWKKFWNVFWLCLFDFSTGLSQGVQEL